MLPEVEIAVQGELRAGRNFSAEQGEKSMARGSTVAAVGQQRQGFRTAIPLALAVVVQVLSLGCHREESLTATESVDHTLGESLDRTNCDFSIYWPPKDPQENPAASTKPLLRGTLTLDSKQAAGGAAELRLVVTVTRPSEEADRQFWNSQLAFADITWMNQVRVWDAGKKWLWPNLPYLLRLPGLERIERYGGMDPGKHVDNDFAAVLIRKYDADGKVESGETKDAPLVSAEWRADGAARTDLHTIVHVAKSDEFLLHLGGEKGAARGQVKVWLIYADFLGARPPRTWPRAREWAGGILAFFEIDWETSPGRGCRGTVRRKRPENSTGFKWAEWVVRQPDSDRSEAQVRLSDTAQGPKP
jgi:hypothetical protein